jgi:FtsZ-binding cell division protein ZapB
MSKDKTNLREVIGQALEASGWLNCDREDWNELCNSLAAKDAEIADLRQLRRRNEQLETACMKQQDEIQQILGKALNYPWFKDDPKNFPDATEADGVCVGDHVAESLAMEAADLIKKLRDSRE